VPNNRSMESLDLPQPETSINTGVKHDNVTTVQVPGSHGGQEKRTRFVGLLFSCLHFDLFDIIILDFHYHTMKDP